MVSCEESHRKENERDGKLSKGLCAHLQFRTKNIQLRQLERHCVKYVALCKITIHMIYE